MREAAVEAERIVVIGTGWIGSEVSASLRMLGRDVVVIGSDSVPLERVLGPEIGAVYRDLHLENGVAFRSGTSVARIIGTDHVQAVETGAGERTAADLVVAGIGVEPRTSSPARRPRCQRWHRGECDPRDVRSLRIFAAGDVAGAWHPFYDRRLRTEHWANAKFQGAAAGSLMLGANAPYDRIPYFYSDQYDLGMEYTGRAERGDRLVVRGSLTDREFVAFWIRDGRVVAGMNANIWDVAKPIERLIRSRALVDPERLADQSVQVEDLVPAEDAVPAG